jgi:kynurenine formamidase
MNYIDLSHEIEDGMITYKGLPAPIICDYLSRKNSKKNYDDAEFQIGKIEMVTNTGTYIDSPFHRYENGKDLSEISLTKLVQLPGLLVHAPYNESIEVGIKYFEGLEIKGRAILICTGWDVHWRKEAYFENHPFLTEQAAIYLRNGGADLVGIDSHNIDDTRTRRRPVHSVLLKDEILIVEHLCNLHQLTGKSFSFTATPPKFAGAGTFPVRAFAETA